MHRTHDLTCMRQIWPDGGVPLATGKFVQRRAGVCYEPCGMPIGESRVVLSSFSFAGRCKLMMSWRLLVLLLAVGTGLVPCVLGAQKETAKEVPTREVEPAFK